MSQLRVYVASAGAGKTHSLTREYLRLVLRQDFRTVQAVTFTNKATEEMKERIIAELAALAHQPLPSNEEAHHSPKRLSAFFDELCLDLNCTPRDLKDKASKCLRDILLDYGSFRVKTIDAFFQEILRAFARELNLSGNFRLSLEADQALEAAVVAVLAEQDSLDNKDEVQQWITQLAKDLIRSGKGHNIKKAIQRLANELKREEVRHLSTSGQLPSREAIKVLKSDLNKQADNLGQELTTLAQEVLNRLKELDISPQELSRETSGGLAPFFKLVEHRHDLTELIKSSSFTPCPKSFVNALEDQKTLIAASNKNLKDKRELIGQDATLADLLEYYNDLAPKIYPRLYTIYSILELLNSYGLISEVDIKLREQQRRDHAMLLMDAPSLIHTILNDKSGVQFIYEKIGAQLQHQMIDEFQDTSRLQYENFRPLLEEGLSSGGDSLVVGDVKQSIYRFRGSDSSLLEHRIFHDFGGVSHKIALKENWRSTQAIVDFNNHLYRQAADLIKAQYEKLIQSLQNDNHYLDTERAFSLAKLFSAYYADLEQNVPEARQDRQGLVAIHHYTLAKGELSACSDEESEEVVEGSPDEDRDDPLQSQRAPQRLGYQLAHVLMDLQRRGYRPCDIAILVRNKRQATFVSDLLRLWSHDPILEQKGYSLELISAEALLVNNALSVRFVIAALSYIVSPSSREAERILIELYQQLPKEDDAEAHSEVAEPIEQIRAMGRTSLYETIETLLAEYCLPLANDELAHQIKLLDIALGFQQDLSADIADFVQMWHTSGDSYRLAVPEDERKIHLMTVHKSKGLGFPVVLLPFPHWPLVEGTGSKAPILWCQMPASALELNAQDAPKTVPVQYGQRLSKGLFVLDYLTETAHMQLDALNLLYVATTRAKTELHIWLPDETTSDARSYQRILDKDDKKDKNIKSVLGLIKAAIDRGAPCATRQLDQSLETLQAPVQIRPTTNTTNSIEITPTTAKPTQQRIEILREGLGHFDQTNPRLYGRLMHYVLSRIETRADIRRALQEAETQGLMRLSDREQYATELEQWLEQLEYQHWFDGSAHILRELPIIGGGIVRSKRPDRIMLYDDGSAEVLDYKFGARHSAHERQIKTYVNLLERMGYTPVRGYVWYVLQGEVCSWESQG